MCQFQRARPNWLRFVATTKWDRLAQALEKGEFTMQNITILCHIYNGRNKQRTAEHKNGVAYYFDWYDHRNSVSACVENGFYAVLYRCYSTITLNCLAFFIF